MSHTGSDKKVIFRRIKGRIVPIKVDLHSQGGFKAASKRRFNKREKRKNLFQGTSLIGLGVGITIGADVLTGLFLGRSFKKAAGSVVAARDITRVAQVNAALGRSSKGLLARAAKLTFGSLGAASRLKRITKVASFIKASGFLLGTAVTTAGVGKVAQALSSNSRDASNQVVQDLIGAGLLVAGAKSLRKGLRVGLGAKSGFKFKKSQLEFKFETGQQL